MLQVDKAFIESLAEKDRALVTAAMKYSNKKMAKLRRDSRHLDELVRRVRNCERLDDSELDEGLGLVEVDTAPLLEGLSQQDKTDALGLMKIYDKRLDEISRRLLQTKGYLSGKMERMAEYRAREKRSRAERGQL